MHAACMKHACCMHAQFRRGLLENSVVGKAFAHDALCVPDPEPVEGCDIPLPYFIVGDDIFGLKTWLLRSFPGRSQLSEA